MTYSPVPIRRESVISQAAQEICRYIEAEGLSPGSPLPPETTLSQMFGDQPKLAARGAARAAWARLRGEGRPGGASSSRRRRRAARASSDESVMMRQGADRQRGALARRPEMRRARRRAAHHGRTRRARPAPDRARGGGRAGGPIGRQARPRHLPRPPAGGGPQPAAGPRCSIRRRFARLSNVAGPEQKMFFRPTAP